MSCHFSVISLTSKNILEICHKLEVDRMNFALNEQFCDETIKKECNFDNTLDIPDSDAAQSVVNVGLTLLEIVRHFLFLVGELKAG